jgi:hypothetical protein
MEQESRLYIFCLKRHASFKNSVNSYDYIALVTDEGMSTEHWWNDNEILENKTDNVSKM